MPCLFFDTAYSIATENHGILTAYEARRNGIASKDVARWVRIGRFVKLGNGVYKSTQYPASEEESYAVAVAQCGRGAYLCGETKRPMGGGKEPHEEFKKVHDKST